MDVDQHPNLGPAVEKAVANGISVAVSNPCIELWFILHFHEQTAHIERDAAQAISKKLLGCDKALDQEALRELMERYPGAKEKAVALDDKHRGDDRAAGSNPSSGVWRLIDRIADETPGDAGG